MFDPSYPAFPIFSFLGFVLPLIPLPWHFKAWNSGTCYYMIWASISCLNQFVNSVVWADNAINRAPIWCDISIRIMMASQVALPISSLCINRRLYHIATSQAVVVTRSEKRRAVIIDTLLCVVYPFIHVAIQYIIQGHRFNIYENIGCFPALYNTPLMYILSAMWPVIIGLVSGTYAILIPVLSLCAFARRRATFSQFLQSNRSLTVNHYFRLMALAFTEVIFTTPLAVFMIVLNATGSPVGPWRSWADTHLDYERMELFPALLWRQSHMLIVAFELTRWVNPLCSFIFFGFFGFAEEARKNYRAVFWRVAGVFGYKPAPEPKNRVAMASIGHYRAPSKRDTYSGGHTVIALPAGKNSVSAYSLSSISSTKVPDTPVSTEMGKGMDIDVESLAQTDFTHAYTDSSYYPETDVSSTYIHLPEHNPRISLPHL